LYSWRHLVANFFSDLKEFGGIATRYEKTEEKLQSVYLPARDPSLTQMNVNAH
jgi:transposase